jgi:hypothetical protein
MTAFDDNIKKQKGKRSKTGPLDRKESKDGSST